MSASSNQKGMNEGDPAAVYKALGTTDYDAGQVQENASPMHQVAPSIPVKQAQAGTAPIRWGWWAAGFAISAAIWAGIALAFAAL